MSSLCVFLYVRSSMFFPPCKYPFMCIPSGCMFSPCSYVPPCACPSMCMPLRVYVPRSVCMTIHVHFTSVYMMKEVTFRRKFIFTTRQSPITRLHVSPGIKLPSLSTPVKKSARSIWRWRQGLLFNYQTTPSMYIEKIQILQCGLLGWIHWLGQLRKMSCISSKKTCKSGNWARWWLKYKLERLP